MMLGKYDRQKVIGTGTFGNVYLVRLRTNENAYVLKEVRINAMSPAERQQALTEVTVLARCRHKNIIRYKEAALDHERGILSIVMEHAECGDMYAAIKRQQGIYFKECDVISWFIQITLALQYIHNHHILHRDLKTQNIFLTSNKLVKVGDFGIARVLKEDKELATTAIGTPYYLSPEICQRKPYNCKSDIWALGCVLFEMTSLVHPFQGQNFHQLVCAILKVQYTELPSHTSPLIEDLIKMLLATDPEQRPSADEIIAIPALQPHIFRYIDEYTSPRCNDGSGSLPRLEKKYSGCRRFSSDDVLDISQTTPLSSRRRSSVSTSHKSTSKLKRREIVPPMAHVKSKISSDSSRKQAKSFPKQRSSSPSSNRMSPKKIDQSEKVDTTLKNSVVRTYTLFRKALGKGEHAIERSKSPSRRKSISSEPIDKDSGYRSNEYSRRVVASITEEMNATSTILESKLNSEKKADSCQGLAQECSNDDVFTNKTGFPLKHSGTACDPINNSCSESELQRCPHSANCFQCMLEILWKNRIGEDGNIDEKQRNKLRILLQSVFGTKHFVEIYRKLRKNWTNSSENQTMKSVSQSLDSDKRQFLPLLVQLVQMDLFKKESSVSMTL